MPRGGAASRTTPYDPDDLIAVGIIRKPHGVRGEASVEPLTDFLDRFFEIEQVVLLSPDRAEHFAARISAVRVHAGRALLLFDGIDSPERVKELRDWSVEIPASQARKLEEGEYFLHDLEGMTVVSEEGRVLGVIEKIEEGGGGLLFSVRKPGGKSFDMPFVHDFLRGVDLEAKKMTVSLPAGIENLDDAVEDQQSPPVAVRRRDTEVLSEEEASVEVAPPDTKGETAPRLRIDIVTIFPGMFDALVSDGVLAKGIERGALFVKVWDLRDFTTDKHRTTDDEAYGGGAGMVMRAQPVFECVERIRSEVPQGVTPRVLMMSPQGAPFSHARAVALAEERSIILLCGRYEGFDERIRESLVDEEVSVGDFVVSGGEIPAMLVADAVARMIEGVVGKSESVEKDSFYDGLLDYPHYTRPAEYRGLRVPEVLLSGDHEKIRKWRKEQSLRATLTKRPDLLGKVRLDAEGEALLRKVEAEIKKPDSL